LRLSQELAKIKKVGPSGKEKGKTEIQKRTGRTQGPEKKTKNIMVTPGGGIKKVGVSSFPQKAGLRRVQQMGQTDVPGPKFGKKERILRRFQEGRNQTVKRK